MVLIYSAVFPILLIPFSIVLMNYFEKIYSLMPSLEITENSPLFGVVLAFFYVYFLRDLKKFVLPRLLLVSTIVGVLIPKFFIFAIPFLSLNLCKLSDEVKYGKTLVKVALIINLLFTIYFLPIDLIQFPPKQFEHQAVQEFVKLCETENCHNDWTLGHLIHYYGGQTNEHSGHNASFDITKQENAFILSNQDINCLVVKQYSNNIFGNNLKIYDC